MDSKKKTVLLVDDDEDLVAQMKLAIEKEFNVIVAHSGEEALERLKQTKPDCIVLDVMMNNLSDGLEATKQIKGNDATKNIPVIMLTSVTQHYDYRTQVGEDYFPYDKWLDKPVQPQKLLSEIRALLK